MRLLALHESIEDKRLALSKALDRPVVVCSRQTKVGQFYRLPGENHYQSLSAVELYLSKWWDQHLCVKREGDVFYYDLHPAPWVYLVAPVTQEESKAMDKTWDLSDAFRASFRAVGLQPDLNLRDVVRTGTVVPENLQSWVRPIRRRYGNETKTFDGLAFVCSENILSPHVVQPEWKRVAGGKDFDVLQAPGQYPRADYHSGVAMEWNRVTVCERDPGPCVMCRGASGQRLHIGQIAISQEGAYPIGLVCRSCFPEATKQWQAVLDAD